MSEQRLNLVATRELVRRMLSLEGNEDFQEFMKQMNERMEGLAIWTCLVEDEVKVRWAQGRVTEMNDWLRVWTGRREYKAFFDAQDVANEGV